MFLLACIEPHYADVGDREPVEETGSDSARTTWGDPILRERDLPLDTLGMELTDALVADGVVVVSGQQQSGQGGIWTWDPQTGDTDQLNLWTVQDVCWDGAWLWGVNRDNQLFQMGLQGAALEHEGTWQIGGLDGGVGCDAQHLAWARGERGFWVTADDPGAAKQVQSQAVGVLVDGERVLTVADDTLSVWGVGSLEKLQDVELSGTCRQLEGTWERLVVACGGGGVYRLEQGEVTGHWRGHVSARHAALMPGGEVLVAGWSELVVLDADMHWLGSEAARSATMAVTSLDEERLVVAEWNSPWVAVLDPQPSPEARLLRSGEAGTVVNDGNVDLIVDGELVAPGGRWTWAVEGLTVETNDPDEPELELTPLPGLGDPAPDFVEQDTQGATWDLQSLRGEVVWLGLFQDG